MADDLDPEAGANGSALRVAVTGGAGFIGSHVVDHLVAAGHRVRVLDVRPPHRADVAHAPVDIGDVDGLVHALADTDVVFHLAGVSNVNHAFERPLDTVAINIAGTANVWEAARRNHLRRAVLASTVWVYAGADEDHPLDEEAPFHLPGAGHIYTSSKIAAEMLVHNYRELYGVPFTILRYGIPFGPRMRDELLIPRFVGRAIAGEPLTINGDGRQFRNYVYVTDLADAHLRVLADVAENEVFNLEGREPVSVRQLVDALQVLFDGRLRVEYLPTRAGDYTGREVSAAKAFRLLGWQATTSFEEGLGRYVAWYRAHHDAGVA
jgi:UDP-glucose 4-epimerase